MNMKSITLVLLVLPLILLNLGCNSKSKKLKALKDKKDFVKDFNKKIIEPENIDLKQFINDFNACVDSIFKNAVSGHFKNLSAKDEDKMKQGLKNGFVLREGILNGDWSLVEEMAKGENIFELDTQKVAALKEYFNDPNKAPEDFMWTTDAQNVAFNIYINAKLRGKTDICKKLEGSTSILKGSLLFVANLLINFDSLTKESPDEIKEFIVKRIKEMETNAPEDALIARMLFGIVD
jgi:hypothetical protein